MNLHTADKIHDDRREVIEMPNDVIGIRPCDSFVDVVYFPSDDGSYQGHIEIREAS